MTARHSTPPNQPQQPPEGLFPVYTESHDGITSYSFEDPLAATPTEQAAQPQEITAPVVDIRERAGHMVLALDALAQANKRHGFAIASETPGLREPIQARYPLNHLEGVKAEARFKETSFAETARNEFAAAFRLGGLEDDAELDRAYIGFKHTYGGTANHAALDKIRKNLRKLQEIPGPPAVGDRYVAPSEQDAPVVVRDSSTPTTVSPDVASIDVNRRRAAGSIPKLTSIPDKEAFIPTAEDAKHISPEYLRESLYGKVKRRSYNGVALNESEYAAIPLNIRTLVERGTARAVKPHSMSNALRRGEVEVDAPVHILERMKVSLTPILQSLDAEITQLEKFQEILSARGFQRTDEATLRELTASSLQMSYLDNMLDVVAHQRDWTPGQRMSAGQALYEKLYREGSSADRMDAWNDFNPVALQYAKRRRIIIGQRKSAVEAELRKRHRMQQQYQEDNGLNPING